MYYNKIASQELHVWSRNTWPPHLGPYAALTLTFNDRLDDIPVHHQLEAAQKAVHHFDHCINTELFGNDFRKRHAVRLGVLAVVEGAPYPAKTRLHYHLKIQIPPSHSLIGFHRLCVGKWQSMFLGHRAFVWVEPVYDDGWNEYLAKTEQKPFGVAEAYDPVNTYEPYDFRH